MGDRRRAGSRIRTISPTEDWRDPPRPMGQRAIRIVSDDLRSGCISGRVLIGGGIGAAYRTDKMKEMAPKRMGRAIRMRCAAAKSARVDSVPCARYSDCDPHVKQISETGWGPYDAYILFGGRCDNSRPGEFITRRTLSGANISGVDFASVSAENARGDFSWNCWATGVDEGWERWGARRLWPAGNRHDWRIRNRPCEPEEA